MHKPNFFLSLITVMTILASMESKTAVAAERDAELPRLVVNILIEQLRSDYLDTFGPLYGEEGLRRLRKEGLRYVCADYPFAHVDRSSAAATLATGAAPAAHGIVAQRFMNRETLRPILAAEDSGVQGVGTADRFSPRALAASTLSDQLKLATDGRAFVVSIAPQADVAVFTGGHAADQTLWIDDRSGNWVTSTYYGALPLWADRRNTYQNISRRLEAGTWQPLERGTQTNLLTGAKEKPFSHRLKGDNRFTDFKTSALVNDEIAAAVADVLNTTPMGTDGVPDLLNVSLYAGTFRNKAVHASLSELQDTYARLDRAVAAVIRAAEDKAGKGRVLATLTATGTFEAEEPGGERFRMPGGVFDMRRAVSLLNIYLANFFGKGDYVEATFDKEIFLRRRRIDEQRLDFAEVQRRAADFLSDLSGVKTVAVAGRTADERYNPTLPTTTYKNFFARRSGDLTIELRPGWRITHADGTTGMPCSAARTAFPVIFYGPGIAPGTIGTPITVDCIAPTVSKALRIRAPNACDRLPLF